MLTRFTSALLAAPLAFLALAGGTPDAVPRCTVETTTEVVADAALVALGSDGSVRLKRPAKSFAAGQFVGLRQEGRPRPAPSQRDFVRLSHGDHIPLRPGAPVRLEADRLYLTPAAPLTPEGDAEVNVYAPYVACYFRVLPAGASDADLFFARLAREPRMRDVAFLRSGDRVEGKVIALNPDEGCRVRGASKDITVPWTKLAGIAWSTTRQAKPRRRGPITHAVLDQSARLNCTRLTFDGKRWSGRTWFGLNFGLPASALIAAEVRGGPAVDLSELKPTRYEHTPYLNVRWPLTLDAAPSGRPIRLGGSTFDRGLGLHTAAQVTYDLAGKYRRFEAVAGLDDRAGPRGRARLAVLIDGKRHDLDGGHEFRAGDVPAVVRLDLRGARTLTLIAEFGVFGGVQGEACWGNARLIKDQ